jgi:hypothetical protein
MRTHTPKQKYLDESRLTSQRLILKRGPAKLLAKSNSGNYPVEVEVSRFLGA